MADGRRVALLITNSVYDDSRLAGLTTPDADGTGLADILKEPEICGFDEVELLQNSNSGIVRLAIANFYRNRKRDDLLLLYFSGHGVLDNDRQLYLAVKDTSSDSALIKANGVSAAYVNGLIDNCRSRRQIVMLDCCHSGAFARGSKAANSHRVNTGDAFDHNGYGTYVITATDTLQYAWEGDKLEGRYERSLFTHHVVEGLRTGAADIDRSGQITIEDLYQYVHDRVREDGDGVRKQTPTRWTDDQRGALIVARNPALIKAPPPPQYQGEISLAQMRQLMLAHLEVEDIKDIAFDLNIPEHLLGDQPSTHVRRVLGQLDDREQLPELMAWLWRNKRDLCVVLFGEEGQVSIVGRPNRGGNARNLDYRIEAAMPRCSVFGETTEVWAMICTPLSIGLKGKLPAFTELGHLLNRDDLREEQVVLEFPVIDQNQLRPRPITIAINYDDTYFEVLTDQISQNFRLYPGKDTTILKFNLKSVRTTDKTNVEVQLFDFSQRKILIGTVIVSTSIVESKTYCVDPEWKLAYRNIIYARTKPAAEASLKERPGKSPMASSPILESRESSKKTINWVLWGGAAVLLLLIVGLNAFTDFSFLIPAPTSTPTSTPEPTSTSEPTAIPKILVIPTDVPGSAPSKPADLGGHEWLEIPAGPFSMGAAEEDIEADSDERPLHELNIPYTYWIAKYETTNAQYARFVADGNQEYEPSCNWPGENQHPVVCISWQDAIAYAEWLSGQIDDGYTVVLPSEAEWEKAARGSGDARIYPWGDEFDGSKLNCWETSCPSDGYAEIAPVGSLPEGASPYGVEDMAGNVWEWTRSAYEDYPYVLNDDREDLSGSRSRVLRGGSWSSSVRFVRVSLRDQFSSVYRFEHNGFRVAIVPSP